MDRGAWQATASEVARVGHNWVTEHMRMHGLETMQIGRGQCEGKHLFYQLFAQQFLNVSLWIVSFHMVGFENSHYNIGKRRSEIPLRNWTSLNCIFKNHYFKIKEARENVRALIFLKKKIKTSISNRQRTWPNYIEENKLENKIQIKKASLVKKYILKTRTLFKSILLI